MAKVAFTKLGLKVDNTVNKLNWMINDTDWIEIEIKYYLPIEEKLDLIADVINKSIDENGYYNPYKVKIFLTLEVLYAYTNINFTDKMKENPLKTYDLVVSTGLFEKVQMLINQDDWLSICENIFETIENVYSYKNSVMGILDTISTDYSNLNFDAASIQKMIGDPDNLGLLREVLDKLG